MRGSLAVVATLLPLLVSGCVSPGAIPLNETAMLEDTPFGPDTNSTARPDARVQAAGCEEVRVLVPANATALRERVPDQLALVDADGAPAILSVSVTRCDRLGPNGSDAGALVTVAAQVHGPHGEPGAHGYLLHVLSTDDAVASELAAAGLPARPIDEAILEGDDRYTIATELQARTGAPVPLEIGATAVSIQARTPFGSEPTLAEDLWYANGTHRVHLQRSLTVEDVGGVSGEFERPAGSPLAAFTNATSLPASGTYATYDATLDAYASTDAWPGSSGSRQAVIQAVHDALGR